MLYYAHLNHSDRSMFSFIKLNDIKNLIKLNKIKRAGVTAALSKKTFIMQMHNQ